MIPSITKGQLISKQNCWAITSPKKQTKRTQNTILSAFCSLVSWVHFVCFLGEVSARQFCFEIYWPLVVKFKFTKPLTPCMYNVYPLLHRKGPRVLLASFLYSYFVLNDNYNYAFLQTFSRPVLLCWLKISCLMIVLKFVHYKNPVTRSSFLSKVL